MLKKLQPLGECRLKIQNILNTGALSGFCTHKKICIYVLFIHMYNENSLST